MDRASILNDIAAEAARGELAFPTSTEIALKVKSALDDPQCHIDTAARLVESEPLLAARAVALANSLAYNPFRREVTNIRAAVSRLGFRTLRSLAMALATRQMVSQHAVPEHRAMAEQLWEHTTHVAALARVIARQATRLDPETALFAGIVHEVGSFYLLARAQEFPGLLDLAQDAGHGDIGSREIGRTVLQALSVPEAAMTAMEGFWSGQLALPPKTLGDVLLLADSLASIASPLQRGRLGTPLPSAMLDVTIGEETLLGILEESAEEVQSLVDALRF